MTTSCHIVNFVFTPTQLIQNLQYDTFIKYTTNSGHFKDIDSIKMQPGGLKGITGNYHKKDEKNIKIDYKLQIL